MNKKRRKMLSDALVNLESASEIISVCATDEEEAYDNLPDGLKESEKGECMYDTYNSLEDISSSLDDVISGVVEIIES